MVPSRMVPPLHGHILDQGSGTARFTDHQDTEEEVAVGARASDRCVVYTVVLALSDGGDTSMRILGQEELAFTGEAGSGVAFKVVSTTSYGVMASRDAQCAAPSLEAQ